MQKYKIYTCINYVSYILRNSFIYFSSIPSNFLKYISAVLILGSTHINTTFSHVLVTLYLSDTCSMEYILIESGP